jgi:hypothetical protein
MRIELKWDGMGWEWKANALQPFTQPQVAFIRLVQRVARRVLGQSFHVRGIIEADVLLDLRAAVCEQRGADGARGGRSDQPVGEDGGDQREEGECEVHDCGW